MTARQWTLKEPAAIFFIGSLLDHGHYIMVVIVLSSKLDLAAVSATNPSSPRVGICPVPGVCSIESRSRRSHDQSEAGDSVCRPCAPGVHKLGPQCRALLKNQCQP